METFAARLRQLCDEHGVIMISATISRRVDCPAEMTVMMVKGTRTMPDTPKPALDFRKRIG